MKIKKERLKKLIREVIKNEPKLITEQVTSLVNAIDNDEFWAMFPTGYAAQFPFTMSSPSNNFADANGMMIGIAANNDNLYNVTGLDLATPEGKKKVSDILKENSLEKPLRVLEFIRYKVKLELLMAKPATIQIKLVSTADTGFYYVTKKNPRTKPEKLEFKKYDPKARKHVIFKEAKIK